VGKEPDEGQQKPYTRAMNKARQILTRPLIVLLLLCLNFTQAATLEELFFPSPTALIAACDEGFETQSQAKLEQYRIRLNASPMVLLQPTLASAFVNCSNAAKNKQPKPRIIEKSPPSVVYVHGTVKTLEEAKAIKTELLLENTKGEELARLSIIGSSTIAAESNWKRECVTENDCSWIGRNINHFLIPESLRSDLVLASSTLSVVVDRLGKREVYRVPNGLNLADARLDPTFGDGGRVLTDFVSCFAVAIKVRSLPDGKFMVGGSVGLNGQSEFGLARYEADGRPDTRFGVEGQVSLGFGPKACRLVDFVVQADGRIVVVGYAEEASKPGTGTDVVFMRFTKTGNLDKTFGRDGQLAGDFGGRDRPIGMVAQSDGSLVIAGNSRTARGSRIFLSRISADGKPDQNFGNQAILFTDLADGSEVNALLVQPDDKIVVAGQDGTRGSSDFDFLLVRYERDGKLDANFGRDGRVTTSFGKYLDSVQDIALQPDGKIVAAGYASDGRQLNFAIARYDTDGKLDTGFGQKGLGIEGVGANAFAYALTLLPEGRILVVGAVGPEGREDFLIMRFQANGQPDLTFSSQGRTVLDVGANDRAVSVMTLPGGATMVVGSSASGSRSRFVVLRLLP
jgi:uncharacterized delta-60 repeat protein